MKGLERYGIGNNGTVAAVYARILSPFPKLTCPHLSADLCSKIAGVDLIRPIDGQVTPKKVNTNIFTYLSRPSGSLPLSPP